MRFIWPLKGMKTMKTYKSILALAVAGLLTVPAFADELLIMSNPNTGDNSMIPLAIGVMAVAAIVLVVVLILTRGKK